jgi:hypothetical protein
MSDTLLSKTYFLDTIVRLRKQEEIILYGQVLNISLVEEEKVIDFLETEYYQECLEYPFESPQFSTQAALWGAKILYFSSQLILYREFRTQDMNAFLVAYENEISPSELLSADLCLRFIPQILHHIKLIDPTDTLIDILEKHLSFWHYSKIGYTSKLDEINLGIIYSNKCLEQLYVDRIISRKDHRLAQLPMLKEKVIASMGNFASHFWKEL